MEHWIAGILLLAGCGFLGLQAVLILTILQFLRDRQVWQEETIQEAAGETPEEQELRRVAAEAQRRYEQGFVNLMRYDGSPGRKEREG